MQTYIKRFIEESLRQSIRSSPVIALLGPRQCGKSTLAKKIIAETGNASYLDLEKPPDLRKLDDPEFVFSTQ